MKRKGFSLIELIVGIFLIGLVTIVALPIIQNSYMNYSRVKERQHMLYLCEMVVERMRFKDNNLNDIFIELETNNEIVLESIGTTDLGIYKCSLSKTKETDFFIDLNVRIYIDNEMGSSQYVEYKTAIKK